VQKRERGSNKVEKGVNNIYESKRRSSLPIGGRRGMTKKSIGPEKRRQKEGGQEEPGLTGRKKGRSLSQGEHD